MVSWFEQAWTAAEVVVIEFIKAFSSSFYHPPLYQKHTYISMEIQILKTLLIVFLLNHSINHTTRIAADETLSHSQPIFSQSPTPSAPPSHYHRHYLRRILLGLFFGSLTGFILSISLLFSIRHCLFYVNRIPLLTGPVVFSPKISPKALQCAVFDEDVQSSHLLGSSPTSKCYRVELEDGVTVAVKRVEPNCPDCDCSPAQPETKSALRKVQQGLETLALVNYRNVMSLRAYVRHSHDRFSLVYDYAPNGSLEDAMKQARLSQLRMGWDVRHRIAVGIVKGLRYLHFEHTPRLLHYNLKPTNVLLDDEFEPRLADCGVLRLLCGNANFYSTYAAPECFQSCRYTDKSDIFSFGVILGTLLTGRDPTDTFFSNRESGSLGRWLRRVQQTGEARQALDKDILGEEFEEDEMLMAMRIAVVCLSDSPADRPSSDELVAMLTQLHSF